MSRATQARSPMARPRSGMVMPPAAADVRPLVGAVLARLCSPTRRCLELAHVRMPTAAPLLPAVPLIERALARDRVLVVAALGLVTVLAGKCWLIDDGRVDGVAPGGMAFAVCAAKPRRHPERPHPGGLERISPARRSCPPHVSARLPHRNVGSNSAAAAGPDVSVRPAHRIDG
jgi:hypothetical protein